MQEKLNDEGDYQKQTFSRLRAPPVKHNIHETLESQGLLQEATSQAKQHNQLYPIIVETLRRHINILKGDVEPCVSLSDNSEHWL